LKFFTKDWYKEMTTMGFLVFPETIEEWEESIQMYKENGIDFQKNCKEALRLNFSIKT
jgi:hypothetical protein